MFCCLCFCGFAAGQPAVFVKVLTDKQTCFVGEPITTGFALYADNASVSQILKQPELKGFDKIELLGLQDSIVSRKIINGKKYDVHTLRKVLLFPQQAGLLHIDAMQVQTDMGMGEMKILSSDVVPVSVKPLPENNEPVGFSGLVGQFEMKASIIPERFAVNEQARLMITISGRGNFHQVPMPEIKWPQGFNHLESVQSTVYDKDTAGYGQKTIIIPFEAAHAGTYNITINGIPYFDTKEKRFVQLANLKLSVDVRDNKTPPPSPEKGKHWTKNDGLRIGVALSLLILLSVFLFYKKAKAGER
ncbi:MAG: BatD family protein [Niabella sp.]